MSIPTAEDAAREWLNLESEDSEMGKAMIAQLAALITKERARGMAAMGKRVEPVAADQRQVDLEEVIAAAPVVDELEDILG